MDSLLKSPVQLALPHAIPFRVILEEHRRRNYPRLIEEAKKVLCVSAANPPAIDVETRIAGALNAQEKAYEDLLATQNAITSGEPLGKDLQVQIDKCARADWPLINLLHGMEATAICLSGGGIRCATLSLGVLEGLAKFCNDEPPTDNDVLASLDYLSTVSGGGYIGSWLSSWIYREAVNAGGYDLLLAACDSIEQAVRLLKSEAAPKDARTLTMHLREAGANLDSWKASRYLLPQGLKDLETTVTKIRRDIHAAYGPLSSSSKGLMHHLSRLMHAKSAAGPAAVLDPTVLSTQMSEARDELLTQLASLTGSAFAVVRKRLAGVGSHTGGDPEAPPLRHLRSYTSYLAPDLGFTLDTFTLGAIILRNLIVNWTMLLPVIVACIASLTLGASLISLGHSAPAFRAIFDTPHLSLLSHRFVLDVLASHPQTPKRIRDCLRILHFTWGGVSILVSFALAAVAAGIALPSHKGLRIFGVTIGPGLDRFRRTVAYAFVTFVLVGVSLVALSGDLSGSPGPVPAAQGQTVNRNCPAKPALPGHSSHIVAASVQSPALNSLSDSRGSAQPHVDGWVFRENFLVSISGYLILTIFIARVFCARASASGVPFGRGPLAVWGMGIAASLLMAAATGGLLELLERRVFPKLICGIDDRLFVLFAPPLVLAVILVSTSIYCAMMGLFEGEDDREWWVRSGGALLSFILVWMACGAVVLYGVDGWKTVEAAVGGLVVGGLSSWLGFSAVTPAAPDAVNTKQLGAAGKFLSRYHLILPVLGGVSILLMILSMAAVTEQCRAGIDAWIGACKSWTHAVSSMTLAQNVESALILAIAASLVALLFNVAININLFSLHGMYRMRLMRAYLGASNLSRHPDPFTQFDPDDTPRQAQMPCFPGAPMHLLNATLNLTGTRNPALRQRRGEGFSFSPVACGGWRVGYVPTALYAGGKLKDNRARGITLATTMSISGAAANPNMGYQSSPLLSLLMTFFNVRLGMWLPNPAQADAKKAESAKKFLGKTGPFCALKPLLSEAFGLADDNRAWVELSDGGHFEDLALYEMVLRRCRHIIVVDGGQDEKFGFEDLGNAIRKIQIDLGVPIEFGTDLHMAAQGKSANRFCAVARIRYGYTDLPQGVARDDGSRDGWLVYIKPSMTETEPADILQYQRVHSSFPHESTGDQFFTESQFESYRHLGSFMVESIVKSTVVGRDRGMSDFLELAKGYSGYAAPPVGAEPRA